jgi:hypothetical protein
VPWGEAFAFLPRLVVVPAADPNSALIALPIRSASRLKSATIRSISNVRSFVAISFW